MTDDHSLRGWVGELARDGAIVVDDRFDPDRCERLADVARDLVSADLPTVETDDLDEWTDRTGIRGYPTGPGLLEVVNAHLASEALDALRDDTFLEGIVNGYTESFYRANSLTVGIRRGPTDPEPYHVEAEDAFVAVVYLTDCETVADGPYAYVHGSHDESPVRRSLGSLIGSITDRGTGEAIFYEAGDGTAYTGRAGTAIVAHGRGYQRFLPVADGHESVVATIPFTGSRSSTEETD